MNPKPIKREAQELIDSLPEDSSWEELMYRIYVRQKIDRGIEDAEAERVHDSEDLRKRYGIGE